MARAVMEGINPYAPLPQLAGYFFTPPPEMIGLVYPSPHPPPAVLLFLPFGFFTYPQAAFIWFLCELACIGASAYLALQWWQGRRPSLGRAILVTLLLLALAPFWEGLLLGQLSSVVLLLLFCAWRSNRQVLAGIFLGFTLSLKFMGWPIWLFFLIRKKWRAAGVALGVVVLAHIAAAMVMGIEPISHYYRSAAGSSEAAYRFVEFNFSVWTLGWRIFAGMKGPFESNIAILPLFENYRMAPYASLMLLFIVVGTGIVAVRSKDKDVSYAVLFCLSAIVGPLSWIHYLVLLFLPFTVALRDLKRSGFPFIQTATWLLLIGLLFIPDYALINFLPRFNINHSGIGPVTISFGPGLLTLLPLGIALGLMALVCWSAFKGAKGPSVMSCIDCHLDQRERS